MVAWLTIVVIVVISLTTWLINYRYNSDHYNHYSKYNYNYNIYTFIIVP